MEFLGPAYGTGEKKGMPGPCRPCTAQVRTGIPLPDDEDAKPSYLEYDGDLYWVNINRRGELWINTKEKPRPMFKTIKGTPVAAAPVAAPPAYGATERRVAR